MGVFFSVLLYIAALVFFLGVGRKVFRYARTPAPLKIPTTPAPTTRWGVVLRLCREVVFFESLFKASKWTWLFGWLFHAGLFVALLAHLRYVTEPVWWWVALIAPFSPYAGIAMVVGLSGLLARRLLVDRVRYISAPSDYLMLVFLMLIAGSGLSMRYFFHTDIIAVKQFALSLLYFDLAALPGSVVLFLHLLLVAVLLIIFPFSKLLHAPGLFFSPSRNQVDNPRERRHIARWAAKGEKSRG
ncbi:MAG: respiratory nitrate reductase subunit gamma [Granulosicoccus sp.]|nr:respiratory nitrate reductase subunit gamma [Granulosicoccus sp.]